jgi:hypothetical protein
MGLFGGGGGNIARRAGEDAAKSIRFAPPDLSVGGLGEVSFDTSKAGISGVTTQLTPEQQAQQAAFGGLVDPAVTGVGGLSAGVLGAGQAGLEQAQSALSAFGAFDPMQAAAERFGRLDEIMQERRMQDRSALESRLLAQGRLDSTAGARQLSEFEAGIERERAQMLERQFGEAQTAQANLANIAANLTGLGQGAQQQLLGVGTAGVQGQQLVADPLFRQLALSGELGALSTQAQQARASAISGHNQIAAGAGGGSILGGLATGALTAAGGAFGGPLGAAAGRAVGGLFGGGGGGFTGSAVHAGGTR